MTQRAPLVLVTGAYPSCRSAARDGFADNGFAEHSPTGSGSSTR
jgi:hypothetical protein